MNDLPRTLKLFHEKQMDYSKVSKKRTVSNKRTVG